MFKERLDWDVSVSMDWRSISTTHSSRLISWHLSSATLLVVFACCPPQGATCWRIRSRVLLDGHAAPKATRIWESSRFCVDTKSVVATAENGLRGATFLLFAAMIEWGQQRDLDAIATVTDLRMERILRRAGWHLDRLGTPRQIGATKAVAALLPITDDALSAIRATGKISGLAIDAPSSLALAA